MHELSVALSIIDGVLEEVARKGGERVTAVYLRIGPLSGVSEEALNFAYELACEGTLLEGSRLVMEPQDVFIYCSSCQAERKLPSIQNRHCPECGQPAPEVVRGTELEIAALEMITA
jgi:hydrogenase nickel incorporation protein HypA/HybF